jgi:hypothetical protein
MKALGMGLGMALFLVSAPTFAADYDLAGIKVGMTADEVVSLIKQNGVKKPMIRQEQKPDRSGAYVSYVIWDDAASKTHYQVEFSVVSERAKRIEATRKEKLALETMSFLDYAKRNRFVPLAAAYQLKEDRTAMLQTAAKKFGQWTEVEATDCRVQWGSNEAVLVQYCEFPDSQSFVEHWVSATVRLTSPATDAREKAEIEAAKPKAPAPKL